LLDSFLSCIMVGSMGFSPAFFPITYLSNFVPFYFLMFSRQFLYSSFSVWYFCFDLDRIGSTSGQILPCIWYKWLVVCIDLTYKSSWSNNGYQASPLSIISTKCWKRCLDVFLFQNTYTNMSALEEVEVNHANVSFFT
jgi:hypothetical protein